MTKIEGWKCDYCGDIHDTEMEALRCEVACRFMSINRMNIQFYSNNKKVEVYNTSDLYNKEVDKIEWWGVVEANFIFEMFKDLGEDILSGDKTTYVVVKELETSGTIGYDKDWKSWELLGE